MIRQIATLAPVGDCEIVKGFLGSCLRVIPISRMLTVWAESAARSARKPGWGQSSWFVFSLFSQPEEYP